MNKNKVAFVGLVIILLSTYLYVYARGLQDGERNYKRSQHMLMALECAYNFGLHEGEKNCN